MYYSIYIGKDTFTGKKNSIYQACKESFLIQKSFQESSKQTCFLQMISFKYVAT